jgi:hypothetical protein
MVYSSGDQPFVIERHYKKKSWRANNLNFFFKFIIIIIIILLDM